MKIENKRLSEITPYEKNPRKNDSAVDAVANSIREFGFKVPVVIDKDGVIVCGHTRYKAAKKLKLDTVPCVIADDLTKRIWGQISSGDEIACIKCMKRKKLITAEKAAAHVWMLSDREKDIVRSLGK